ncbi:KH domain RNA-binding protein [Protomyces lactucae-debilis]|uniref:KH domain RNA-binding protein n=1 Tax=Protomyces lactucae-debilis TaxID=2754530 RepID=A0A1Y2FDS9_PROLT|nr:KH domain RNA-binding protein [Protomyces lactucae-debilis]ORY82072.1 KH domain RNA-binding protein [Protomyces lactucae-debilis]
MSVADTVQRLTGISLGSSTPEPAKETKQETPGSEQSTVQQPTDTQPTSSSQHADDNASEVSYTDAQLTLRALVSTKEAGIIIGKAGKNVADLRDLTGVKAGVSKVVPGVHDRVLTITGALPAVTQAYTLIAQTFLENPVLHGPGGQQQQNPLHATIRLLVSHNLMGSLIGRQGAKIKAIQDSSGVRMAASKEMLPQSQERIVEVTGELASVQKAIWEIGKCLVDDWERGVGTVLYNPSVRISPTSTVVAPTAANGVVPAAGIPGNYLRSHRGGLPSFGGRSNYGGRDAAAGMTGSGETPSADFNRLDASDPSFTSQTVSIPAEMVGCVIGKGGTKITEIRRQSGSRIAIAKEHDEAGERQFTLSGTKEGNARALQLIYEQLEREKERRAQHQQQGAEQTQVAE